MKRLAFCLILVGCRSRADEPITRELDVVSREALYDADLPSCWTAARRAFDVLHLQPTRVEIDSLQAAVETRLEPARIWMHRMGDRQTRVVFSAGHVNSLLQIKAAFDRALRAPAGAAQN